MEKYIGIKRKDVIKLGIMDENDKPKLDKDGNEEYIEFDIQDLNFQFKLEESQALVNDLTNKIKMKLKAIDNKYKDRNKSEKINTKYAKECRDLLMQEYFPGMEKAINLIAGENATNKIFGSRRYPEMFEDLVNQLKPYLKDVELGYETMSNRIAEKYGNKQESNVLTDE